MARRLGVGLREARLSTGRRQVDVAARAGLSQPEISELERGLGQGSSLLTWAMAAEAAGRQLAAFLEGVPGADLPRDYEHLKRQQLVVQTARAGGWIAHPELLLDPGVTRGRSVDVALERRSRREAAVVEIWDWFDDVGAAKRSLDGKIAALGHQLTIGRATEDGIGIRVGGLWVVRGTRRNRTLVAELSALFASAFPASSAAWLRALGDRDAPMPAGSGFLWTDVAGVRLAVTRPGWHRHRDVGLP